MNRALLSSKSMMWLTPTRLFDELNRRFAFTLDPCCTVETALCPKFYTPEDDGLSQSWEGERVFMNPPYGKDIAKWVYKACFESKTGALVVGLLPARTDTEWWQRWVLGHADVSFIRGRLKFKGATENAPFPNAIAVWWGQTRLGSWR